MTIRQQGGIFGRNPTFNNVTVDGTLTVDQIVEKTGAAGITLDGVTLKDGNVALADGKGIDFSATSGTGTSELFDDYEEGTWTPVVADAATGGNLCTMSGPIYTFGSYTKVGRMVHIQGSIRITGVTGVTTSNVAYITGLPFAPDASQNTLTGGYVTRANYIDTPAGCVNLGLFVRTDGSMMVTTAIDRGVAATLTIANIQSINANHFLAFNAAYYV